MPHPIHLSRPRLLTPGALGRIHEAAVSILGQVGMRVLSPEGEEAAVRLGLSRQGDRVLFPRKLVDAFADETRVRGPADPTCDTREPKPDITLHIAPNALHGVDLDTDAVVPLTTARLVELAKFVDTLESFGVFGAAPGLPSDVPAELRALQKYRIGARYCRGGRHPVEIESARMLPFLLDMAEALGHPLRSAPVYIVSPLTLGGSSLEYALAGKDRLQSLWVSNMSSLGATAPIRPGDALAVGVAEVIGGALLAREASGRPVGWSVRVCPFEPRAMALTLGAPEEALLQFAFEEVNAWYHGRQPGAPGGALHTQAKLPDAQAVAEHLSLMLTYALLGTRGFGGAGQLSLDEVFSPELLMIDIELRDHVQRLVAGLDVDCDPAACLAEAAAGAEGGFLGLESTAQLYRSLNWRPRLFFRGMLQEWQAAGAPDFRARAKDAVRRQLAQHEYELEPDLRREVDRIYTAAERALNNASSSSGGSR